MIKIVNHLVKIHETRDPIKIAKYEGFYLDFQDYEEIKGYYFKVMKRKFIVINQNLDELGRSIVCAHELGHGLLHNIQETYFLKEYTYFPEHSRVEREANAFCAELILNNNFDLSCYYDDGKPLNKAILQKLVELKRENRRHYQ